MRTHYPFFGYAWTKLWVLVVLAFHANGVIKFLRGLV